MYHAGNALKLEGVLVYSLKTISYIVHNAKLPQAEETLGLKCDSVMTVRKKQILHFVFNRSDSGKVLKLCVHLSSYKYNFIYFLKYQTSGSPLP